MVSTITYADSSPLLPVYLVCDTSGSMNHPEAGMKDRPIDVLNESIFNLFIKIFERPHTITTVHLSVVSFNTKAILNRAMEKVDRGTTLTTLKAQGCTNLASALELLERRLDIDEKNRLPRRSYRPVAFILTDGKPTDSEDDWGPIIDRLGARVFPPRIIPCALGTPTPTVIQRLTKAYGANSAALINNIHVDGRDLAQRVSEIFSMISKTLSDASLSEIDVTGNPIANMDTVISGALSRANNANTVSFDQVIDGYR